MINNKCVCTVLARARVYSIAFRSNEGKGHIEEG